MYASRSRCASPPRSTLATSGVPSSSSALYTSPMQPPPKGRTLRRRSPRWARTPSDTKLSATGVQVVPADVLDQTLRRLLHEVEDAIEAVRAAIVGVRHLTLRRALREVEEGPDDGVAVAEGRDGPVVVLVHGEDVVEGPAVFWRDLAGPQVAYIQAPKLRALQRTLVRRAAGVPVARAGRVDLDVALKALAPDHVLEDALGDGTAADVPHADEQNPCSHGTNIPARARVVRALIPRTLPPWRGGRRRRARRCRRGRGRPSRTTRRPASRRRGSTKG